MKVFLSVILVICCSFSSVASGDEPPLVRAVVRELTHDPNSPPLEFRNMTGKQPPSWIVRLEILEVFRGDPKLKGQVMITATADSEPEGNGRFVIPRLNEGDIGIWAIKSLADGSWAQVYSPYEVEKGIRLPLINGRDLAYEAVLARLSGGNPTAAPPTKIDDPKQDPPSQTPTPRPTPTGQRPDTKKPLETAAPPAPLDESSSATLWLVLGLIASALAVVGWWLKRRS